jgi:hypothetical protein
MTTLANGMCIVTANQAGTDIYATTAVDRNIPVGTELPAALNFLTGYKDNTHTVEGQIGFPGNQWWCMDCSTVAAADGTSFTFTASWGAPPQPSQWDYNAAMFQLFGRGFQDADLFDNPGYRAGVKSTAFSGPLTAPKGVQIDIQGGLHFNLAQNTEWFGSTDNKFNVELFLGHFNPNKVDSNNNACAVTLKATVTPTTAAATDYSISLKNQFVISESCDLSGLDIWNELQTYPVTEIKFSASKPNADTANASGQYVTQFTLSGPIFFQ